MATIEQIDQLLKMRLDPLIDKLSTQIDKINDRMDTMNDALQGMKVESISTKEECKLLKSEVTQLQKDYDFLNQDLIKKNLIIFGLPEQEKENLQEILLTFFIQKLNLQDLNKWEIVDARRMGRNENNRGIKVEMSTRYRKMQILENARALKGTNISIRTEYTRKVMQDRKTLKPFLIEAKEKGLKAKLVQNKLKVNDQTYTVEDMVKNKGKSPIDSEDEADSQFNVKSTESLKLAQKTTGAVPKEKRKIISPPELKYTDDENLTEKVKLASETSSTLKKYRQQTLFRFDKT